LRLVAGVFFPLAPTTSLNVVIFVTIVVINRAFFLFLLHNHIINKNKILSPAM